MKAGTFVHASALLVLFGFPAAGQQFPRIDIEATCRSAPALTAEDRDPVQRCIRDEEEAQRQLQSVWTGATAANRQTCEAETQVGGSPSYVDVLTCLQMSDGSISTAPQRSRRQP